MELWEVVEVVLGRGADRWILGGVYSIERRMEKGERNICIASDIDIEMDICMV